MTGACLELLHKVRHPIWPWAGTGRGLLVEAFPAAQLFQWKLPYQGYNRKNEQETTIRKKIVRSLATRINLGSFREVLEQCADALDSVICTFAARAVSSGRFLRYAQDTADTEGLIAIEVDWPPDIKFDCAE